MCVDPLDADTLTGEDATLVGAASSLLPPISVGNAETDLPDQSKDAPAERPDSTTSPATLSDSPHRGSIASSRPDEYLPTRTTCAICLIDACAHTPDRDGDIVNAGDSWDVMDDHEPPPLKADRPEEQDSFAKECGWKTQDVSPPNDGLKRALAASYLPTTLCKDVYSGPNPSSRIIVKATRTLKSKKTELSRPRLAEIWGTPGTQDQSDEPVGPKLFQSGGGVTDCSCLDCEGQSNMVEAEFAEWNLPDLEPNMDLPDSPVCGPGTPSLEADQVELSATGSVKTNRVEASTNSQQAVAPTPKWTCQWGPACRVCLEDDWVAQHLWSHVSMATEENAAHVRKQSRNSLEQIDVKGTGPGKSIRCTWGSSCTRRFASLDKLREHLNTHAALEQKMFPCQWSGCGMIFPTGQALLDHALAAHTGKGPVGPDTKDATPPESNRCMWQGCCFQVEEEPGMTPEQVVQKLQEHVMAEHAHWDGTLPERVVTGLTLLNEKATDHSISYSYRTKLRVSTIN